MPRETGQRRICFVTGTRAEFGLMQSTLAAIQAHPNLKLQIIATGSHLSSIHGRTINSITSAGLKIDTAIRWKAGGKNASATNAMETGRVMSKLAREFARLKTDVVLVVGDRTEAFAAAAAGHISALIVAHVHGGDRAPGQVDDALRHAITKLAHIHFPATVQSEKRLIKLGEDRWRVKRVGSPGIDGIAQTAWSWKRLQKEMPTLKRWKYALIVLHPVDADEEAEYRRAKMLLTLVRRAGFERIVIIYPNNDPGYGGIVRCWRENAQPLREILRANVERGLFIALLANAAVLLGNSSSGIIEAASFGTPVIDIEPRQHGRERSANVRTVEFQPAAIARELKRIYSSGRAIRFPKENVYGGHGTGRRIADFLARIVIDQKLRRKLIAY